MFEDLRQQAVDGNKQLGRSGLSLFTWGNLSVYDPENKVMAIKPSGVEYEDLTPEDIVVLDLEGNIVAGELRPSSDTPTHLELYRRFEGITSIVHTHSTNATSFAQAEIGIDCLGTTHADHFRGTVPVTRRMTDTEITSEYELNTGRVIVEHFETAGLDPIIMPGVLVARHGPFVWGPTPEKALYNAVTLEEVARINLRTLQLNPQAQPVGETLLSKHFDRKHGVNAYYGQEKK